MAASAPDLLVIDGAEKLATGARDSAGPARDLRDLLPQLVADGTTVILGMPDADVTGIFSPETNYFHLDLDEARPDERGGTDSESDGEHTHAVDSTNMEGVQS